MGPTFMIVLGLWTLLSSPIVGFKITKFEVPSEVHVGSTARLECWYDLTPYKTLYTLRWLKDNVEFYRFDPATQARHNFYKMPDGLHLRKSNGSVMILDHASKEETEGIYTCEVTTFPQFARVSASKKMDVVPHAADALELKNEHNKKQKFGAYGRNSSPTTNVPSLLSLFLTGLILFSC